MPYGGSSGIARENRDRPTKTIMAKGGMKVLFLAIFFLVFALFIVARVFRGNQAIWLGMVLFTFGCCILGLVGLVPRFGNYRLDGLLSLPMDEPGWAWALLARLSLYDFIRFRLWSAVGFLVAFIGFAISYSREKLQTGDRVIIGIVALGAVLMVWNYDPGNLFEVYKRGALLVTRLKERRYWEMSLNMVDWTVLGLICIAVFYSIQRIGTVFFRSTIIQKRIQAVCVGIGHMVLGVFFIILFCVGRVSVLNMRTMATTLLPLGPKYPVFDSTYLRFVPLAAFVAMGAVMLAILRYGFLGSWRIGVRDLDRQIKVANQAVRLALHSFKNQFLALQMAMNMARAELADIDGEAAAKARTQIQWAQDICSQALMRLNVLHTQADRVHVNPQRLSLVELWKVVLHDNEERLELVVVTNQYAENVYVLGDREHLQAVLENLLINACDAMALKELPGYQPQLLVEINREYEWRYIRITDNGVGISKENLHKVFRPFFSTKPAKSNWGMGLTYCHRVIKIHRGFINIQSREGIGTTVEVVLRGVQKI